MEKTKQVTPWALILTVVLIIVKVLWAPSMSWWIVFLPIIIPFGILVLILAAGLIIAGIAMLMDNR